MIIRLWQRVVNQFHVRHSAHPWIRAAWWRQTLLCLILILCGSVDRVEAYGGATYLDYGYPTLWGYTATWKDPWDPDYGFIEAYDPWCECWRLYYFADYVSVVGDLRTPSGWDYYGYWWDFWWAALWAWVDSPERDWWYLFGWHYLERDWYVYDDESGWWYYIGTYYYYLGATAYSAWVPWPEVSFQGVKDICIGERMTVQVSARNVYPSETVRLLLQGGAIFQGGGTEFIFSGSEQTTVRTVEIVGQTASNQEDDVILRAEYPYGDTRAQFTVIRLDSLQVTNATPQLDGTYYLATVGSGYVFVSAITQPTLNEANLVEDVLAWSGGEPDGRLRRRVSRALPNSVTTVTAGCGSNSRSAIIVVVEGCGTGVDDERTQMKGEYLYYWAFHGLNYWPVCDDFTQSAGSAHFSFVELNTGDYSWAIIRDRLLTGLENTRSNYGYPMPVTSGYRNPARNQRVGGQPNSRHVYGDAADIAVRDNNGDGDLSDDSKRLARAALDAGATYTQEYPERGYSHVHMDWR